MSEARNLIDKVFNRPLTEEEQGQVLWEATCAIKAGAEAQRRLDEAVAYAKALEDYTSSLLINPPSLKSGLEEPPKRPEWMK